MNVLQLISSGGFFGAENVVLQLSAGLEKRGSCFPTVGVLENLQNPHLELVEACRKQGIDTALFPCRGKFDLKTVLKIRQFITGHGIDVIHSHGYKSNIYACLAAIGTGCVTISTCHNWIDSSSKLRFYSRLDLFFLKFFRQLVAVSPLVEEKLLESGIPSEKVKVIYNGVNLERFSRSCDDRELRRTLGIKPAAAVVGTVGRLSAEKGHGLLLQAALKVLEKHPDTYFVLVGDGPLRDKLQSEFASSRIIFAGPRHDVEKFYSMMDIFVLPSLTEGLPMALLEAMASSKPVIATGVGAIPEVFSSDEIGRIVPPGDESALADAIVYFLENLKKAQAIGKACARRVSEDFSAVKMTENYFKAYSKRLKNP